MMKASPAAWSRAYAIQAKEDLAAYETLKGTDLANCQGLHFLQMACEKVAKAHECWGGADPVSLQSSHKGPERVIPIIAKQLYAREAIESQVSREKAIRAIRDLAREIELLAPAVDDGRLRPENCEYPWEDDQGRLQVPAKHDFSKLSGLHLYPMGRTFLKVVAIAIEELAGGSYVA